MSERIFASDKWIIQAMSRGGELVINRTVDGLYFAAMRWPGISKDGVFGKRERSISNALFELNEALNDD